ncbi:MAG: precorrin-4 C(11)-methyltransferase [Proteobacteria bacterium]|nr:precorrin-4 C(11)-methyltransferase [Pseudomonadota bacterium]
MKITKRRSQVYFIGAGPGDPELITVKGHKCIQQADLVLYTGSLVPKEVVACAKENAKVVDSSSMTLNETHAMILETVRSGGTVARVHTGDPSLYGAIKEQMILLDHNGISYEVIPGVTVAFAAAAAAKISFTLPEKVQTLIFTRMEGRTPVPDRERLRDLARHNTSMALYLSSSDPDGVVKELMAGGYSGETPVVVAYRVGWPDELLVTTQLSALADVVKETGIHKQAVFLVLPGQKDDPVFSRLYSPEFSHGFRK